MVDQSAYIINAKRQSHLRSFNNNLSPQSQSSSSSSISLSPHHDSLSIDLSNMAIKDGESYHEINNETNHNASQSSILLAASSPIHLSDLDSTVNQTIDHTSENISRSGHDKKSSHNQNHNLTDHNINDDDEDLVSTNRRMSAACEDEITEEMCQSDDLRASFQINNTLNNPLNHRLSTVSDLPSSQSNNVTNSRKKNTGSGSGGNSSYGTSLVRNLRRNSHASDERLSALVVNQKKRRASVTSHSKGAQLSDMNLMASSTSSSLTQPSFLHQTHTNNPNSTTIAVDLHSLSSDDGDQNQDQNQNQNHSILSHENEIKNDITPKTTTASVLKTNELSTLKTNEKTSQVEKTTTITTTVTKSSSTKIEPPIKKSLPPPLPPPPPHVKKSLSKSNSESFSNENSINKTSSINTNNTIEERPIIEKTTNTIAEEEASIKIKNKSRMSIGLLFDTFNDHNDDDNEDLRFSEDIPVLPIEDNSPETMIKENDNNTDKQGSTIKQEGGKNDDETSGWDVFPEKKGVSGR